MVVRKCVVESSPYNQFTSGMYQLDYVALEHRANKKGRGRPKKYDEAGDEIDNRTPAITVSYMYGKKHWIAVERMIVFDGKIYSKNRKFYHVESGMRDSDNPESTRNLEANINTLFEKIKMPRQIREELKNAFYANGQKIKALEPILS